MWKMFLLPTKVNAKSFIVFPSKSKKEDENLLSFRLKRGANKQTKKYPQMTIKEDFTTNKKNKIIQKLVNLCWGNFFQNRFLNENFKVQLWILWRKNRN